MSLKQFYQHFSCNLKSNHQTLTLQEVSTLSLFKPSVIADIRWLTVKICATGNIFQDITTHAYEGSSIFKFDARQFGRRQVLTFQKNLLLPSSFFLPNDRAEGNSRK
jgi:hypothetical protein